MEGARVFEVAALFAERGDSMWEQAPDISSGDKCAVICIDAFREQHEIIEAIVEHSAGPIAVILESNGYPVEAGEVRVRARRLARQNIPTVQIYRISDKYLEDTHPRLYEVYRPRRR